MADKLSLKWIDGNDLVAVPGTTTSVHISGYTEAPTFNVDDPTMWTPLSVLSGLASGFCERRAVLNDDFVTAAGTTVHWIEGTTATRDQLTKNCMNNMAAGIDNLAYLYYNADVSMRPIGSAATSNYMTVMDAAITTLVTGADSYVDSTGASFALTGRAAFDGVASSALATANSQTETGSSISMPVSNGGTILRQVMANALPVEWAKERKWMLDEIRYTGSGGADVMPINNIGGSGIELNDDNVSVSKVGGWFPVDSLYSSSYVDSSGTYESYSLYTLGQFGAIVNEPNQMTVHYSSFVASAVDCDLYNSDGSYDSPNQFSSAVDVAAYFGAIDNERGYHTVDYAKYSAVRQGQTVTAVSSGFYHVQSGGILIMPPMSGTSDGNAPVAATASISAVTVDSGGSVIMSAKLDPNYASMAVTYSGDWQYAASIPTTGATSSETVDSYTSKLMRIPQTVTAVAGGTMYVFSNCCYIPYEQDPDDPDAVSCYIISADEDTWNTTWEYSSDLADYALSSTTVVAGSQYTATYQKSVYTPLAGVLYYTPNAWVLSATSYTVCACNSLNMMDGGIVIPSYNGTQYPATRFRFEPGFSHTYHNYVSSSFLPGVTAPKYWVCISGAATTVQPPRGGTGYLIVSATATFSNTTAGETTWDREMCLWVDSGGSAIAYGTLSADVKVVNGGQATLQGGAGLRGCWVQSGCSLTLKNGTTSTPMEVDGQTYSITGVKLGDQGGSYRPDMWIYTGGTISIGVNEAAPSTFKYFISTEPVWTIESGSIINFGPGFGLKTYTYDSKTIIDVTGYTSSEHASGGNIGIGNLNFCTFNPFLLNASSGTGSAVISSGWNQLKVLASGIDYGGYYDTENLSGTLCWPSGNQANAIVAVPDTIVNGTVVIDGTATTNSAVTALRVHRYYEEYATVAVLAINSGGGDFKDHYPEFYVRQFPTQAEIDQATSSATTT